MPGGEAPETQAAAAAGGAESSLLHPRRGVALRVDAACTACALSGGRSRVVVHRGRLDARVLFVGEAPGAQEDAQGQPFVGRSGKLLDQWIAALDLEGPGGPGWCITNIVRCRPPGNRVPQAAERDACWQHLRPFLAFVQPAVVVAVGNTSAQYLARKGVHHRKVRHPSYYVRGFGGDWRPEVAALREEVHAALARGERVAVPVR